MGYTHYWNRSADFTTEQWEKICLETLDIIVKWCDKKRVTLAFEHDSGYEVNPRVWGGAYMAPKVPEVSPDLIRFNGWRGEGHETFYLTRVKPDNPAYDPDAKESFDFCKTNRKPYDIAVMLVLLSMKRHAPDTVRVASDGDWDTEWAEARRAYKILFGVHVPCPWETAEV